MAWPATIDLIKLKLLRRHIRYDSLSLDSLGLSALKDRLLIRFLLSNSSKTNSPVVIWIMSNVLEFILLLLHLIVVEVDPTTLFAANRSPTLLLSWIEGSGNRLLLKSMSVLLRSYVFLLA